MSAHDIGLFLDCVTDLAIYVLILYVLVPKQPRNAEPRFFAMLGFRDYDSLQDALIDKVSDQERASNDLELTATFSRFKVLMNTTRYSQSIIESYVDPEFGVTVYDFKIKRRSTDSPGS